MQISTQQKKKHKKLPCNYLFPPLVVTDTDNRLSSTVGFHRSNQHVVNLDESKKRSNFLCLVHIFEVSILNSEYIFQIIMF